MPLHTHGIDGDAVERHVVDYRPDDDASAHELSDGVDHVGVIAAEPINPAHHEGISGAQQIEETMPFRPIDEAGSDAGHTVVGNDLVDCEPRGTRLGFLMLDRLLGSRDSRVKHRRHVDLRPL
jgi:hypothetical protein